jgi:hypothetical protein
MPELLGPDGRPWTAAAAGADVAKHAVTVAPYANATRAVISGGNQKRGAKMLKNFARSNEWVANAIFRRSHAIQNAKWTIVRTDDPFAKPDPDVQRLVRQLLNNPNPAGMSWREFIAQAVFDLLVLDAGCIEKEFNARGDVVALWPVAGETISVDAKWIEDCDPRSPRYRQYEGYKLIAELLNDQLIYMMHNPSTDLPIGHSPVEVLVRVIEAELYGEQYDYEAMKQHQPAGVLDLGPGTSMPELERFREYYEAEIAGTRRVAVIGGGAEGGKGGSQVNYIAFRDDSFEDREAYKHWLAVKIATVFELDLVEFNLIADVNRSTSKTGASKTDRGLEALGSVIEGHISREIVAAIDPNHGFAFKDLVSIDDMAQAQIDKIYLAAQVITPNEVRDRKGMPAVPWGDEPSPTQSTEPLEPPPGEDVDPDDDPQGGGKKSLRGGRAARSPFGARRARSG